MFRLIWKSDALYLHNIYMGKVVRLYPFDKDLTICAAFIQTIPSGDLIGTYPNEDDAKAALLLRVETAVKESIIRSEIA